MTPVHRAFVATCVAGLVLAACGSTPSTTQPPGATSGAGPTAANATAASTPGAAAGEPCSFLTAEQVGAVMRTVPVEVAERPGRGDCDYFLTAAKDQKVNVGVTTGADGLALFESTKGLGEPVAVAVGDEAYAIYNESIGTLVVARQGDAVITAQVFTAAEAAEQAIQATALAKAVAAGL